MRNSRLLCVTVLGLLLFGAPRGPAQPDDLGMQLDVAFKQGLAFFRNASYAESIPHFEKAVVLASKLFGAEHANTAAIMNTLASAHKYSGNMDRALSLYKESLRIRELTKDPKAVATGLNNLALLYDELGKHELAEPLFLRCLKMEEMRLGKDHREVATILLNLGGFYQTIARYKEAEDYTLRSLKIYEQHYGKDHAIMATPLNNLGILYLQTGRFEEAEILVLRGLRIRESKLAKDHPEVANSLGNLAQVYQTVGRLKEAEVAYLRSLKIFEARLGKEHPAVARSLSRLANLCLAMSRLEEAERLARRAAQIREAKLGKDHPDFAASLTQLAAVLRTLGKWQEAVQLDLQSLKIMEARLPPNHPARAMVLTNLGLDHHALGRLQEAASYFARALKMNEVLLGPNHPDVATGLNSLATIYKEMRRYQQAESAFQRGLKILVARFGKDHHQVGALQNNLAKLYAKMGRLKEAEDLMNRSLEVHRSNYGDQHPHVASNLVGLSAIYQITGRPKEAVKTFEQNLQITQKNLAGVFAFSSESAMGDYLETISGHVPILISMARESDALGPVNESALTWTLRRKGIVLDTLCRFRQAQSLLAPDDPLAKHVGQYRGLKQLMANAALNPPKGMSPEQASRQMAQWKKEVEELETEVNRALTRKLGGLDSEAITVAAVQKRLPPGTALVEFFRTPFRDFKNATWSIHHYVAFVLPAGKEPPRLIDLGEARAIEDGVTGLRQEFTTFQEKLRECESEEEIRDLEKAQEKIYQKAGASLQKLVFAPLRKALGQASFVYLAADGQLNRLPFEALVDDQGKYLVENYRFVYLSSGRDLLRDAVKPAGGTVVFAGPDYKLGHAERQEQAAKLLGKKELLATRSASATEFRSVGWKALPGAAAEAKDIQKLLLDTPYGPVKSYVGVDALEEVLKAMPAPRILHLATHGFFLDHDPAGPKKEGAGAGQARGRLKQMDNPLLRSGIVLAGANTIGDQENIGVEDGWVTAEEIALLNLRGTELVVLSACQTGLGDVKTGEGVYGLRRAFLYAGARTLLTSLFEVPDRETRELMQRFYGGLAQKRGKLEALHTAQVDMIRQRRQMQGAAHPFFWASFVLVGEP
ncbi:MAG TPA: CHAT domain-containing tetratricopeptide repeat protein [Gemmataceae bacterium]|nr:CHAT domain-containing tetratricopeptide repeat protein [Gemmataceae bacterium]